MHTVLSMLNIDFISTALKRHLEFSNISAWHRERQVPTLFAFSEEGVCPVPADGRARPLGPDCHLHRRTPLLRAAWVFTLVLFPVM